MKKTDVRKALDKCYDVVKYNNFPMEGVSAYRRLLLTELKLVSPQASELPSDAEKSPDDKGTIRGSTSWSGL